MRLHTPCAVRYLLRELGLAFFLAGAGTRAGAHSPEVLLQHGTSLVIAGASITSLPLLRSFISATRLFGLGLCGSLGAVRGSMTGTPRLAAACASSESDEPALSYAALYPVALFAVTATARILAPLL